MKRRQGSRALGVDCLVSRDLPQWDYSVEPGLLQTIREIYDDFPLAVSQGTLEAGIFCANMPGVSFVALCPPYYNPHSPGEYFLLSECEKNYKRLLALLARIR